MNNTFIVSPMSQNITLEQGKTYKSSIMVGNPDSATEDFHFKVEVSPFSVTGDDHKVDFQTNSDWSRIVKWIKIDTTEGVLKPGETKQINFEIEVPSDAPAGGQYAMIGVSSNNEVKPSDGGSVQNVFEMASLLYARVSGEVVRSGQVTKNQIPGFVTNGEPVLELSISNNGNIHEVVTTKVEIKNVITGETVLPKENMDGVYETIVMPESSHNISRTVDGVAALGVYEVRQTVNYLDEESAVSTIMIICPIWFIALVLITIASIIGMFIYSGVKRKKRKSKNSEKEVDF